MAFDFSARTEDFTETEKQALEAEKSLISNDPKLSKYFEVLLAKGEQIKNANSYFAFAVGLTPQKPQKSTLVWFDRDYPDCDSDIDSENREKLFDYLREKYGKDRFAQVGALSYYQTKNALNEICKALTIPRFALNDLEAKVEGYAANDERKLHALADAFETREGENVLRKYPELRDAVSVIGTPIHHSTHAGGIVLCDNDLPEIVATDKGTIQLDKDEAERRGLVKIDALGLTNLAIYSEALENAGLPITHLRDLPLDDQKAFDVINEGRFIGLFQFEGKALRGLCKSVHIDSLNDLAAISALARPGPLSSGAAARWVQKRNGTTPVDYPHELLKPYLEETLGELVYQETVMLIANEVAGLDWPTVSKLRKAIGKSQGEEAMKEYGEPFIAGLVSAGVDQETAARFWREILGFGAYGFNKSHAYSYAIVSYWSCWLKAHYPLEYAAASLTFRKDKDAQIQLLRELASEGVSYVPVDPENSTDKWRVVNGKLIGPLTIIKGIGSKGIKEIFSARARGEPLPDRMQKLLSSPVTFLDSLYPVTDRIQKLDFRKHNIVSKPLSCGEIKPDGSWQENVVAIGCVRLCVERSENEERRIQDRISRGRQGRYDGEDRFVEIRLFDDTGEIYAKIGRADFEFLSPKVLGVVIPGQTLICVKGTITPEAPVLLVKQLRVLEV